MTSRCTTIRRLTLAITALAMCLPCTAIAQETENRVVNREYYLKAAFLFHFTSFIDWPDGSLAKESIEVGVLGQDPFGETLDTLDGKVVQGRRIIVKRSRSVRDLKSCAVLFIARSEQGRLQEILSEMSYLPVLTVSEVDGFAHRWGIINFTTTGNRVRFEINTDAAKRANLRISSRLLRVSTMVVDFHPVTAR